MVANWWALENPAWVVNICLPTWFLLSITLQGIMEKCMYFITKYGGLFKLSIKLASCEEAAIWSDEFHLFSSLVDRQQGSVWEFRLATVSYRSKIYQSLPLSTPCCVMGWLLNLLAHGRLVHLNCWANNQQTRVAVGTCVRKITWRNEVQAWANCTRVARTQNLGADAFSWS